MKKCIVPDCSEDATHDVDFEPTRFKWRIHRAVSMESHKKGRSPVWCVKHAIAEVKDKNFRYDRVKELYEL